MSIPLASQLREFLKLLKESGIDYLPKPQTKIEAGEEPQALTLAGEVMKCQACRLSATVTNRVFGQGPVPCSVMLIGEGPGAEEDRTGLPFVGPAGQLLDKILAAVDMTRKDVYLCNVVKCRPPNNRNPLPAEIEKCLPFLHRQIKQVDPKFIVEMGAVAARSMLGMKGPLNSMRGRFYLIDGRYHMVTYHPAALLRNVRYKKPAWEDWKMFRAAFERYKADGVLPKAIEKNDLI